MFRECPCPKSIWVKNSSLSKLPSNSNGVDDPSRQRKPCPSCMQFGHMRRSHQSCPENLRSKQALANGIANRSDDLASDAQSSTNVSSKDENEGGDAINSKADDNGNANAVEAKVINGNANAVEAKVINGNARGYK